ncbi:MAG: DNA mismatch repair endonuclease MutL [Bacillota bacterium]
MQNRIHKLDILTSNKIAAGEVVDKPASVVKELVENAIDAKASSVVVEIKDGGKTYIRVTDNGSGIHSSDVELAFERHATSKIRKAEDLYGIVSLGFRGEALASIGSVGQVELITKTAEAVNGILLELQGGIVLERKEVGAPQGTTVIVKNLFFNTPARLQFMKSTSTETSYISDLMNKLAMSHPDVAFKYISNDSIVFVTSGKGDVAHSIASIYGKEIAKNIYHAQGKMENIELNAFICKPSIYRGTRQQQAVFVNGRYVKSRVIHEAIDEAYKTLLPIHKHPVCFLYFDIPSDYLDVNIHPTKLEIKFENENIIRELVIHTIKSRLEQERLVAQTTLEPVKRNRNIDQGVQEKIFVVDLPKEELKSVIIPEEETVYQQKQMTDHKTVVKYPSTPVEKEPILEKQEVYITSQQPTEMSVQASEKEQKDRDYNDNKHTFLLELHVIGQLFNTYIIAEDHETMYLIDQHAAHERILYEWLMKRYIAEEHLSQQLLVPIVVELSHDEYETVKNNLSLFYKLGFEVEDFGNRSMLLRGVPLIFGEPEAKSFFMEVIDSLHDDVNRSKVERIIMMACKEAVKAKQSLDILEIRELFKQLTQLENPYTCPHGRPIIVSTSKYEIEKKFKRI